MRKRILICTRNTGKFNEYQRLFRFLPVDIVGPMDVGIVGDVQETGKSFEENAILKASWYAQNSDLTIIADDSGLEVDALDGRPGIYSARYGGSNLTDEDRTNLLLTELIDVPGWKRGAQFRSVIALIQEDNLTISEGKVRGAIAHQAIGDNGFGYDPVFWISERAKTYAQMSGEDKDAIGHRGIAVRKILPELQKSML